MSDRKAAAVVPQAMLAVKEISWKETEYKVMMNLSRL